MTPFYAYVPVLYPKDVEKKIGISEFVSGASQLIGSSSWLNFRTCIRLAALWIRRLHPTLPCIWIVQLCNYAIALPLLKNSREEDSYHKLELVHYRKLYGA
jgi:hypothetical protein